MSDLRTRETRSGIDGLDGLDSSGGPSVSFSTVEVFDRIWRFFISMRTGLILMLILGGLSIVGTMVEQAPDAVRADPASYDAWVDGLHSKYGGWTSVFKFIGFYHIFSTWWFRAGIILLVTSILACSTRRTPRLWRVATRPRTHMSDAFFDHAAQHRTLTLEESPQAAAERIGQVLRQHRFRTVVDEDGKDRHLYADRFRWAPFGTVIAHLSFVVVILGFLLSATTGFKDTEVVVPVGDTVAIGHGTGLSVKAESFTESAYADGSPKDYASDLVLYQDGKQVKQQTVRVNSPMIYDGVWLHQSFYGFADAFTIKDQSGQTVFDGSAAMRYSSSDGSLSLGFFNLVDQNLQVWVVQPASGQVNSSIKAGQVQLEIHEGFKNESDPIAIEVISQGKPTKIGDLTYTFDRPLQFTGLIVAKDHGAWVVWLGSALFMIGSTLVFYFHHRRIWVHIRPHDSGSEVLAAGIAKRDAGFAPIFTDILDEFVRADRESRLTERGTTHA